jgi:hypothetical protein
MNVTRRLRAATASSVHGAGLRGGPAGQPPGALKHDWNKSEIWCQLTQVYTRHPSHNWRNVNVNRKLVSPRPHQINVEQIFKECMFEGVPHC